MYFIDGKMYNTLGRIAHTYNVGLNSLVMVVFRTRVPRLIDCVNIVREVDKETLGTYNIKDILDEACTKGLLEGVVEDYMIPNIDNYTERFDALTLDDIKKLSKYSLDSYIGVISPSDVDELIANYGVEATFKYKEDCFESIYEFTQYFKLNYSDFYERYKAFKQMYPTLTTEELITGHLTLRYKDIRVVNKLELRTVYNLKRGLGTCRVENSTDLKNLLNMSLYYYNGRVYDTREKLINTLNIGKIDKDTRLYLRSNIPNGDCTLFIQQFKKEVRKGVQL